eukprot:scaffold80605_cov48-Phaeocystis_antarctica.AAC.2
MRRRRATRRVARAARAGYTTPHRGRRPRAVPPGASPREAPSPPRETPLPLEELPPGPAARWVWGDIQRAVRPGGGAARAVAGRGAA